jgi:leucyl aminopeptidase (aminopeptidase T)
VGLALAACLTPARSCRITTAAGTDVRLDLTGRDGRSDDGVLRHAGAIGNLPAGEGYIAPVEDRGEGTIVFDGSLATYGLLHEPLVVRLAGGRIVDAQGPAADWLLRTLDAGGEHGRSIAELGIGTNPRARVHGNILEDEKAIGTIHLAFGASAGIGGVNRAAVHLDVVLRDPRIDLDGEPLPLAPILQGEI